MGPEQEAGMSNGTTKASELTIRLDLGDRFSEGRVIDARGEVFVRMPRKP